MNDRGIMLPYPLKFLVGRFPRNSQVIKFFLSKRACKRRRLRLFLRPYACRNTSLKSIAYTTVGAPGRRDEILQSESVIDRGGHPKLVTMQL